MKKLVDVSIILDRSGSMYSCKAGTISGFNEFLNKQRLLQKECKLSLYQFDDVYESVYSGLDVLRVPDLNEQTFVPRGMTALYDAICKTIVNTGIRLNRLPEDERPDQILVVIITDGAENASLEYKKHDVASMIKNQSSAYNWTFVYIGANQDAILNAQEFNIPAGNAVNYVSTSKGMRSTFGAVGQSIGCYSTTAPTDTVSNFFGGQTDIPEELDPKGSIINPSNIIKS